MTKSERGVLFAAGALHLLVMLLAMPASPWEFDEPLFFQALQRYDPVAHHPPPPGYPLFIFAGKIFRLVIPSDFGALVTLSVLASTMAFLLLALAFARWSGDVAMGIAGALLFYFSPGLLVHSTLPISEPGALLLVAAALYFAGQRDQLFALFCALAVGWRMQFAILVVPLLLTGVMLMRGWRARLIALAVFTAVCLLWLIPLMIAVGGPGELYRFETRQADYLAAHDADQSRSGWTPAAVAFRFIAHPWGNKVSSLPLLLLAGAGLVALWRRRARGALPLGVASSIYLLFALWVMDPADGVRYAIPFTLFAAFCAGAGSIWCARLLRFPLYGVAALFAAGFLAYTQPVLLHRNREPSPPLQAVDHVRRHYAAGAVPLYDLPLWPHATYYFADRDPRRFDRGLAEFYDRPEVPLFLFADGAVESEGGRQFRWPPSDAYSKLTRNHYRVVSVVPIPPEQRFRVIAGVHAPEREVDGESWRWLDARAALQLPDGSRREVTLTVGLPKSYPLEENRLTIRTDAFSQVVTLRRGQKSAVTIPLSAGSPVLHFTAERSFIPAEQPGSRHRDPRRLAVKLYGLETRSAAAAAEQQVAWRR